MYDDNNLGGIPDELPSGYGYADSQPATVHANTETAKAAQLFEPQSSYAVATTNARGSVQPQMTSAPQQRQSVQSGYGSTRPMSMPSRQQVAQQAPRARVVGGRGFQASGLHTTPTNAISMRARPTEMHVPAGVPKAIRYEDLPGNADFDDDALGADYGLTDEEKAAKKKAKEEAKAKAAAEKAAGKEKKAAEKSAAKDALRGWQQAAQLGLRFDQTRGKWYREVKVAGGTVEAKQAERPLLMQKAKGPAVKRLQTLLAAKGFPAGSSGTFDATVKQQVLAFQNSVGLEADGKVGAETWEALEPTAKDASGDRTVRQYQEGAVAIMKGPTPAGSSTGVVLSPTKFKDLVATLKSDIDEAYGPFPLPNLTPPPANWDFKLGKTKPGFTLDMDKLEKQLTKAVSKFKPSGKAAAAEEAMPTSFMPSTSSTDTEDKPTNWLMIGGIAAGVLVVGGLIWAFSSGGSEQKKPEAASE